MPLIISFFIVCSPMSFVSCKRARLIPVTRGITSVAADDSALTSLVVCLMGVNWLKFYCTQNDWTLNPASSVGTQTPSAARPAAVQRLWSKAFVGGLVVYPTLTALVVRPNKISCVFLRCIAGARLNGQEWTIKVVFILCANDKLLWMW